MNCTHYEEIAPPRGDLPIRCACCNSLLCLKLLSCNCFMCEGCERRGHVHFCGQPARLDHYYDFDGRGMVMVLIDNPLALRESQTFRFEREAA